MDRKAVVLKRVDWSSGDDPWRGRLEGKDIGTNVTVLFFATDKVGGGPRWHVHTYDEIFIIRWGREDKTTHLVEISANEKCCYITDSECKDDVVVGALGFRLL